MAESESDYPDFTTLPDTIVTKIFSKLNLTDKARAARVCQKWAEVFNHPVIWDEAEIVVRAAEDEEEANILFSSNSLDYQKTMLDRYGSYMRDLTVSAIYLRTEFCAMDSACLGVIYRQCRELDSLTIGVYGAHQIIKVVKFILRPITTLRGLIPIHAIVLQMRKLRKFHMKSWPHKDPNGNTILTTVAMNDRIIDIEDLNIYWDLPHGNDEWAVKILEMPEESEVTVCLNKFKWLTTFSVQLCILTDAVLAEFAKPRSRKLERLNILVAYQKGPGEFETSPIKNATWKAVRQNNPHLKVVMTLANIIRQQDVLAIFQPYMPLQAIIFMRFSRSIPIIIESLTSYYPESLESYRDISDSFGIDEDLIRMVNKCTNLTCLVHYGHIHYDTVVTIGEIAGQRLRHLDVMDSKISTISEEDASEIETLITQNAEGEYVLEQQERNKRIRRMEQRRASDVDDLCERMSKVFRKQWKPHVAKPDEYFTV
ncbi:F-box/LRR-repeat protein 21-like [Saccoglossus kowalevskii]|uniref:F-box/LRR-repeat protein 21-like n=1 Tax=Saccoglossus kowalevskii TaxID=10224 RepID=A0ABM0MZG4_SACKO|nr:PREDICTED: F-box/LRR-repeat protein 21-like [Saccoglossus kowalevskii]